jgi:hypothetical protein
MFQASQKALRSALVSALALLPKTAQALTFDHKIETSLSTTQLWDLLSAALSGDMTNGFWPTRYSTISGQVEENGLVTEVVFGSSTVKYRLSNVVPGHRLTYSPLPGEAMQGLSHIEVTALSATGPATSESGSQLHWYGSYEVSSLSPVGLTIRLYEQLFFRALSSNLEKLATRGSQNP